MSLHMDALLASHLLFFMVLLGRVASLHAALLSQQCQPLSSAARAAWNTPLQSVAGIAASRELMAAHLSRPAVSVDAASVDALLGRLNGTWRADSYENAEAKFKAQGWGWALRKLMSKAPCELQYSSAGGTAVACTFSSAGLLETSETFDLASEEATEKAEAGRVTSCWTTLGSDGTLLNLQQGYKSAAARAADEVAYKQLTSYSVDDAASRLTLTEVTLTPVDALGERPPKVTRSWTRMVRAKS